MIETSKAVQDTGTLTSPTADERALVDAAARFLRFQAAALRQALTDSDDPAKVGTVLGGHDASHEDWLRLIADVERMLGDDAAQPVAGLYGFHGRVVGSLERGQDFRLDPSIAAQIRGFLAAELDALTNRAVRDLERRAGMRPADG